MREREKKSFTVDFKTKKIIINTDWDNFVEIVEKEKEEKEATEVRRVVTYVAMIQEYVIS